MSSILFKQWGRYTIDRNEYIVQDLDELTGIVAKFGDITYVISIELYKIYGDEGWVDYFPTGDQDVSGAISTHNTDAGAHAILARKTETMRLLISRTIGAGENVSAITWTQDDAGNALALIDAEIRIRSFTNSLTNGANNYFFCRINGQTSNYFSDASSASSIWLYAGITRNAFGSSVMAIRKIGAYIDALSHGYSADEANSVATHFSRQGTKFQSASISSIYITMSSLTYIPAKTIIEIYGRTA